MSRAEQRFEDILTDILEDMHTTLTSKNKDYGDSFAKLYRKFGLQYALIRQLEKTDRLDNLIMGQEEAEVTNESVEDTIRDIAGYAILTLVTMEKEKENNKPFEIDDFVDDFEAPKYIATWEEFVGK